MKQSQPLTKGTTLNSILRDRRRRIAQNSEDYRRNETVKKRPTQSRNLNYP